MNSIPKILRDKQLDCFADGPWADFLAAVTPNDVQRELSCEPGHFRLERLARLISPAAQPFLEQMAQQAHQLTLQRFGRTIQLYVPLYVSNVCINSCRYCGYNTACDFERTRLSIDEALQDADVLAEEGFRHLLLLSGEDPDYVTEEYLCELAARLKDKFSSLSVEIYPMTQDGYRKLYEAGIDGVTLYQETYDRRTYAQYHVAGPKRDFDKRLDAQDRLASAGMRRLGLGALLGLADWRLETLALGQHAAYLMKQYWRAQVSFSFPRLRPAPHVRDEFDHLVSDREMVQMMTALRLCFADAGIVLSTRESAELRNHLVRICVTRMSAGSKTNPGGYSGHGETAEQFEIDDKRSPAEVAEMIRSAGMEAVWKDWDRSFNK